MVRPDAYGRTIEYTHMVMIMRVWSKYLYGPDINKNVYLFYFGYVRQDYVSFS